MATVEQQERNGCDIMVCLKQTTLQDKVGAENEPGCFAMVRSSVCYFAICMAPVAVVTNDKPFRGPQMFT